MSKNIQSKRTFESSPTEFDSKCTIDDRDEPKQKKQTTQIMQIKQIKQIKQTTQPKQTNQSIPYNFDEINSYYNPYDLTDSDENENLKFKQEKLDKKINSSSSNFSNFSNFPNEKIYGYNSNTNSWHCVNCGIDMGPQNPRQLCGKTYCRYNFLDNFSDDDKN